MAIITVLLMILTLLFFKYSTNEVATSGNSKTIITLNGPWKFKTGDDRQWAQPNFNDLEWETVDLTAPPGAHDGDVGLSGYVPGWTARGYSTYSGYAWYRMTVSVESVADLHLALAGPPAVDDAYQLFIDGALAGSAGDFSGAVPVTYSIQPRMFLLPDSVKKDKQVTIAFRVWMSAATLTQGADLGGIHIAPDLGDKNSIERRYQFQWNQSIKGYIVEIVEPVIFLLLAISIVVLFRNMQPRRSPKWFVVALVLLALVRANQAIYFWWQIESTHQYDIVTTVLLRPLILGAWLRAWYAWFDLQIKWMPRVIDRLTIVYIGAQLLGLPWMPDTIDHVLFQNIADATRFAFVALLLLIVWKGMRKKKEWLTLLAILLVSIGLFSQEFALLHLIPGIYFPYGVGVSRTQYVYAGFVLVMYVVLIQKNRESQPVAVAA
ncbi:glycoside hydrolase [Pseudoflavitalea sp. G-6-1-2]|nr:glycoside hydrolase [Pseudoflavitalea sp. G-6-1-2]